jgi:hypothetical protein
MRAIIKIINLRHGWVKGSQKVDRSSVLGNPYYIGRHGNRAQVIQKYREWLADKLIQNDPNCEVCREFYRLFQIAKFGDLVLACWCKPKACHADVIKSAIEWKLRS